MSTKLYIDTSCIKNNVEYIRSILSKNTNIIAMVKANAYGCSATKMCPLLESLGIKDFGVALVKEGVELRKSGINSNILVTSQFLKSDIEDIISNNLTVSVSDIDMVKQLNDYASTKNKKVNIHIKVDSGMGRLGFTEENIYDSVNFISNNCKNIVMQGIYTHLSCADTDEIYSITQLELFNKIVTKLKKLGYSFKYIHALNSAGILKYSNFQYTHVRVGILLYGYFPDVSLLNDKIKPALCLKSPIIRINNIKKDTKISYGGTYIAKAGKIIATIQIGYADGLPRTCSNKYYVYINGIKCKIVGNICMDMCMVDVSKIKNKLNIGDEVTIFKDGQDIQKIATINHTINYEIISRLSGRIERIFI